ncbi:hypothetical protein QL996_12065 [Planococcus sp. APC 4015]|nr:hypothetical protein [Planococcus sp. APC 4015]
MTADELRAHLRTRRDILETGESVRGLARAVADGEVHRIRRNRYIASSVWNELWPESRHLAEVLAGVGEMCGGAGVVSHASAAAVWGLPLHRLKPSAVDVTIAGALGAASSGGIRRHRDRIAGTDTQMVEGMRCTTLDRTIFDVMRVAPLDTAVACADAVLRRIAAPDGRSQDADAAESWRARMRARADDARGARGVRQARWITEFADGRAEPTGESVTRLRLHRLGFARARCQVAVAARGGRTYWVDLALDDARVFVEFDGKGKYLDEAMRDGIPFEEVLLREKQREDWIRGTTGWPVLRVSDEHIRTDAALRARLAAFGVRAPRA